MKTVTSPNWSVSVTTGFGIDGAILNVSNLRRDKLPRGPRFGKSADYDGKEFPSSKEAFAFALEHGYTQLYFARTSVRSCLTAMDRQACEFDALYRLYKHQKGQNRLKLRNKLERLAQKVSIFHPVANRMKNAANKELAV